MLEPLEIEFDVACTPRRAFEVWTTQIASWWPKGHTVSADPEVEVFLEARTGGRIFERSPASGEHDWGEVTAYEPPHRLAYLWHIRRDRADATQVEIRFSAHGKAGTRVRIEHSGWEQLGADAETWRERNHGAWGSLLLHYRRAVASRA